MRGSLTSSAHWKAFTARSADKLIKLKEKAPKGAFFVCGKCRDRMGPMRFWGYKMKGKSGQISQQNGMGIVPEDDYILPVMTPLKQL